MHTKHMYGANGEQERVAEIEKGNSLEGRLSINYTYVFPIGDTYEPDSGLSQSKGGILHSDLRPRSR